MLNALISEPMRLIALLTLLFTVALRAQDQSYPPHALVVDVTKPPYGAKGTA